MSARKHSFHLDDERADVVVTSIVAGGVGSTRRHANVPTLTCACGMRLAWIATPKGQLDAAYGLTPDTLVHTGRKLPACVPGKGAA